MPIIIYWVKEKINKYIFCISITFFFNFAIKPFEKGFTKKIFFLTKKVEYLFCKKNVLVTFLNDYIFRISYIFNNLN